MHLRTPLFLPALALAAALPDYVSPEICPRKDITLLLTGTSHNTCPLPATSLDPGSHSPWTHPPRCTTTDTQTYCVYTTTTLGPNGLSLIAPPESASLLSPILTSIYHSSFPSRTSARNLNLQPAFEVQDIPGKDKGLVATRFIGAKETFLLDYASLVVSTGFPQEVGRDEMWGMLDEAVDRLVDPGVVRGLDAMGRSGNVVEDVLQTNTFNSNLEIGKSFVVFSLISVCSS
ncbi:hypothetical protein IMZ48_34180 [Candidatus Bathyarchaeota archaeon]|nr:hypothetical protein [Candidatus Bathyarchaeota archaeon]